MINGTLFVNPGSAGQHRLGVVEACYCIVEDGNVILKSTPYPVEETISNLRSKLPWDDDIINGRLPVYEDGRLDGFFKDLDSLECDFK